MSDKTLSHLDAAANPTMVDIGDKIATERHAHARATVILTAEILHQLEGGDIRTKKGAVFQTAIIAGTMGAKRTADLIPLCHPLGLDSCKIVISLNESREVVIDCHTRIYAKTGVEMEALTGASVAALTIYDMCKALSHHIIIKEIRLIEKTGGKSDYYVAD
jgi:cyclic pyranopterin phosphate synthase